MWTITQLFCCTLVLWVYLWVGVRAATHTCALNSAIVHFSQARKIDHGCMPCLLNGDMTSCHDTRSRWSHTYAHANHTQWLHNADYLALAAQLASYGLAFSDGDIWSKNALACARPCECSLAPSASFTLLLQSCHWKCSVIVFSSYFVNLSWWLSNKFFVYCGAGEDFKYNM